MNSEPELTSLIWDFENQHYLKHAGKEYLLPATPLTSLGDPRFCEAFGLSLPYVAGAMANGIASEDLVAAMADHSMLGIFGAAGLSIPRIEAAIDRLQSRVGPTAFGVNLIHAPSEPQWEHDLVGLLIRKAVTVVEASAFMSLTYPLVYYRVKGIHRDQGGNIVAPHRVIAKASRVELAEKFFSPPPIDMLRQLYEDGYITAEEAHLAQFMPVASYVTAEADSGGHTDNRPALTLFPTFKALRDKMQMVHEFQEPLMLGLAGGMATPSSVAAAFAMGAAYVMGGSVHQACLESGTSQKVKALLSQVSQADVVMAPAADMFEMGVQVQVLKKGTMFPMRARKLYDLYKTHNSIEDLAPNDLTMLESQIFRQSIDQVWSETQSFFRARDPEKLERCEDRPKLKMALIFRWYLGQASKWANEGLDGREMDYQVWCGPAMGAFNRWTAGTYLAQPAKRTAPLVARNLVLGALALHRLQILRSQGFDTRHLSADVDQPLPEEKIKQILREG